MCVIRDVLWFSIVSIGPALAVAYLRGTSRRHFGKSYSKKKNSQLFMFELVTGVSNRYRRISQAATLKSYWFILRLINSTTRAIKRTEEKKKTRIDLPNVVICHVSLSISTPERIRICETLYIFSINYHPYKMCYKIWAFVLSHRRQYHYFMQTRVFDFKQPHAVCVCAQDPRSCRCTYRVFQNERSVFLDITVHAVNFRINKF